MGKRQVKEFRPEEVLSLIAADRDGGTLPCPACGSDSMERTPPRIEGASDAPGPIQLVCAKCGRHAGYMTSASQSAQVGPANA